MTDRLERLINLVIALRETRRPLHAAEIRARVAGYGQSDPEAFRRMFERDKTDLREMGIPIETVPLSKSDDRLGYRIDPQRYDLPELRLAPAELAALAIAVQATGLADEVGSGLLKLAVDAGDPQAARLPGEVPVEVMLDAPYRGILMEAQLARRVVRFLYAAPGRAPTRRTVDPYALVHRRGRWYLVGKDHDRDARRAFRLDRIIGMVKQVGEPGAFEPPAEDVGVDDVVPSVPEGAPETAQVLAAPDVAWLVARRARGAGTQAAKGSTTSVATAASGDEASPTGWTAFTVPVGDPEQFVGWVLGFGPELEVLSPPQLRAEVIKRLTQMAGQEL